MGALIKLHNFLIDAKETSVAQPTARDVCSIVAYGGLFLPRFDNDEEWEYDNRKDRMEPLLDGGEHFDDVSRSQLRRRDRASRVLAVGGELPSQQLLRIVERLGLERPATSNLRRRGRS